MGSRVLRQRTRKGGVRWSAEVEAGGRLVDKELLDLAAFRQCQQNRAVLPGATGS